MELQKKEEDRRLKKEIEKQMQELKIKSEKKENFDKFSKKTNPFL
ncbi:hypothetical protein [Spiroplasma endosymbiont of Tiphia femorata]